MEVFKYLLALSFFTDLIDGWLARRFNVPSMLGSRLDSIGDDLTVAVGVFAVLYTKPEFISAQRIVFIILLVLFIVQVSFALVKYNKITSFHTYLAKAAAILQGVFLILIFFLAEPVLVLFYVASIVTMIQLVEEIILIYLLKDWRANVKGIWWLRQKKRK